MSEFQPRPYGDTAKILRDLDYWPRPLIGKACKEKGWQTPDPELPPAMIEEWDTKHAYSNIGLLLGSPFPDGTLLGALDIDNDNYVGLGKALLGNPPCARIGSKGLGIFVRLVPSLKNQKIRVKGDEGEKYGQVLECLFHQSILAIPPSIHPKTNRPYQWVGTPLHEIDFNELPLIGE